ncbi:MAG: hypothetical protein M3Y57_14140 [Acidobacteriota bacterium]|nr:hypothetical protein [Acidobacteriota bacterium]
MRRVLFDQNVPRPLRRLLTACEVKVADEMGWSRTKNGLLLDAAEQAGFEVLLSGDQTIKYEQNMRGRKLGVISMSDNHWPIVKDHIAAIAQAIEQVQPGEVRAVYCGTFVPRRGGQTSERSS